MSNNKALMSHYIEGALISRELHDLMHQYAADARFDAELSGYEDNYELMRRTYASYIRGHRPRKKS